MSSNKKFRVNNDRLLFEIRYILYNGLRTLTEDGETANEISIGVTHHALKFTSAQN
jgi:hypothetical protein